MSSEKKVCTACDNELHQTLFSKMQWKKGQGRRCKKCIEAKQLLKKKRRVEGNESSKKKTSMEEGILSDFVFVYTGGEGNVPKNVVLVHFDSSVVQIRDKAFSNCNHLKEVVLNEGLKSIGSDAFFEPDIAIFPLSLLAPKTSSFCMFKLWAMLLQSDPYTFHFCQHKSPLVFHFLLKK